MPRSTQDCLIHVLLWWLVLLSIVQVAFISFFFTAGQREPAKSSITGGPESTQQPLADESTKLPPPDLNYALIKGQMFTFKADKGNSKIIWKPRFGTNSLIEKDEKGFRIKEAGHYFLTLQVTQKTCNRTRGPELTVSIKYNERKVLLGQINTQTCSTGLLAKVEALTRGAILEITEIPSEDIDDSEALTHLDIIMLQPKAMA